MNVEIYPWHEQQWRRLAKARAVGRFPHAILLSGPAGLGKSAFARRLADALVCAQVGPTGDACGACSACRSAHAGSHPDQHFVRPEEPGKRIKIDVIRALNGKSVLAAQAGGHRVALIEPADALNHAAANALLKTLEEPASRAVLLLVSSHPDRLPATIRSRCQVVKFVTPSLDACSRWLREKTETAQLSELLAVSGGAPLRALEAQAGAWIESDQTLLGELRLLKDRKTNPIKTVEDWEHRPLSSLIDALKRCVSDLSKLISGISVGALYHPGMREDLQSLGQGIDLKSLFLFNDELLSLERSASNNLNPQMMLEHIANCWLQITRPGGR